MQLLSSAGDLVDDLEQKPTICMFDPTEAARQAELPQEVRDMASHLKRARISYAEDLNGDFIGMIVSPTRGDGRALAVRMCFMIDSNIITVIADEHTQHNLIKALKTGRNRRGGTGALGELLLSVAHSYPDQIISWRKNLQHTEDRLIASEPIERHQLMSERRAIQNHAAFCSDLADIADALQSIEKDEAQYAWIGRLSHTLGRLSRELKELDEYSRELAALYQDGVDIRQNRVMQWLTVVATIFMPLTFITSWYGMNFPNLLLPATPWGYPLVVLICILLAVAEILWFRHRGWLRFDTGDGQKRTR